MGSRRRTDFYGCGMSYLLYFKLGDRSYLLLVPKNHSFIFFLKFRHWRRRSLSWFTSSYDSMGDEHRWTLASGLKLSLRWPSNADWRTYLGHSPKPQISTIYPQGNNGRPKANDKTKGLVYEAIAGAAYLLFSFMILTAKVAQSACVLLLIKLTD